MYSLRYLFVLWMVWGMINPLQAQDLIDRYRRARYEVQVAQYFKDNGVHADPMPVEHLPSRADTVKQWLIQLNRDAQIAAWNQREKSFEIEGWQLVRRLERSWFEKKFQNTLWAFLGTESLLPLDTTRTQEIRAHMESYFGPPTQTITELLEDDMRTRNNGRYVQFEYWFVLNDSIPLVFMDVNGPLERGLVVSSDQRFRDILLSVRESFLKDFMQSSRPSAFVDYYYDARTLNWYYAGYDGGDYFMELIGQPNLALGRPWLDAINRSD